MSVQRISRTALAIATALAGASQAHADEGMWTFDNAPLAQIKQRLGLELSPAWLEHLRLSAVKLGASASFVSKDGLLLTNHHVARGCVERLSTAQRNLIANGFVAHGRAEELQCPGADARVLQSWQDVTPQLRAAAPASLGEAEGNAARKSAIAKLEADCKQETGLKCDVVTLYSGAVYHLYRYKEYQDVRLVMTPEAQASDFGGDFDNFTFPRFALDFTLLRAYEDGKPVQPAHYLKLAAAPLKDGDAVFVAGHPGNTDRQNTLDQLRAKRDVLLPLRLKELQAEREMLHAFAARSPESARRAAGQIAGVENSLKAMTGQHKSLLRPALLEQKAKEEADFKVAYKASGRSDDPWAQVERATAQQTALAAQQQYSGYGWNSLMGLAGGLVEAAAERQLPEGERMRGYSANGLAAVERRLRANSPVYKDLEQARLAFSLNRAAQALGRQHPLVQAALGSDSAEAVAARVIAGTKLDQQAERVRLLEGGAAALAASDDAAIALARKLYPLHRALARQLEREVDEPLKRAADQLGQARFALQGRGVPPDATGTLRLSYGRVAGYDAEGIKVPYKTVFGGLFARAAAFEHQMPFKVAPQVAAVRAKLNPDLPLNFASTADIIGGNSGSPVVNKDGELVGLIFDGNLEGLGGRFAYTDALDRAVAVDIQAILAALEQAYGAPEVARELRGR
ncbi:S46 family peptidase [Paucibacter sp. APW11]|uniref:Dipeptidyl-peptidase n=1 Tax=Roseateles aquae TaxID=3077235 RepID=A0ABU3PEM2_9BURK|nr:S46 family peptidase [Paucibacter sp. APW11]MDT9000983.1 S46 family peptidase [Paucibacter sp. APW11]